MLVPLRRLFAVGLWLAATGSATAIVWAGTSTVAADLTDRPPPVVRHRDVVLALQPGASDAKTAPGITAPTPPSSTSSVPPDDADSEPAGGESPEPEPDRSRTGDPGGATATPPPAPPPSQPSSPPTSLPSATPSRPTATYSTTGGVTTVACNGLFIELVSATPNNGYAVNVVSPGPYYVEVHFVRGDQDEPVWAYCLGQPVRVFGGAPGRGQTQGQP